MKVRDFLYKDFSIKNNPKLRKIKLSICGALLTFSFVIIGYKTISLASLSVLKASFEVKHPAVLGRYLTFLGFT